MPPKLPGGANPSGHNTTAQPSAPMAPLPGRGAPAQGSVSHDEARAAVADALAAISGALSAAGVLQGGEGATQGWEAAVDVAVAGLATRALRPARDHTCGVITGAAAGDGGGGSTGGAHAGCSSTVAGGEPSSSGGGGGGGRAAETHAAFGAMGVPTSEFIHSIAAALQAPPQQGAAGKEQFVAWWRDSVHGLALMVHHKSNDPADRGRMAALLHQLGSRSLAMCASQTWFIELHDTRLDSGAEAPAPSSTWQRVAGSMRLDSQQALLVDAAAAWSKSREARLRPLRDGLAQQVLASPGDARLRAELDAEAAALLDLYRASTIPVIVLLSTAVLRPDQMAEFYVQAWPWLPLITPIFTIVQKQLQQHHHHRPHHHRHHQHRHHQR